MAGEANSNAINSGVAGIPIPPQYQAQLDAARARKQQQASRGSGYDPFMMTREYEPCYSPGKWAFRRLVEDTVGSQESFDQTARFFCDEKYTPEVDGSKSANYRKALTDNDWLKNKYDTFTEGSRKGYFEKLYASDPHAQVNEHFKDAFKGWDKSKLITQANISDHLNGYAGETLDVVQKAAQSASALSYDELFGMHDAEKARIQAIAKEQGKGAALKEIFKKDRLTYAKSVLSEGSEASTAAQRAGTFGKKVLWNNEVKWATEPVKKGQWFGAILRPLAVGLAVWDVLSTTARAYTVSRKQGDGFLTSCAKAAGTFGIKTIKTAILWSLGTAAAAVVGAAVSVFALPAIAATVITVLGAAAITYGANLAMNAVVPDPPCTA